MSVELGADAWLDVSLGVGPTAILSPDGAMLAFVGRSKEGEPPRLFLRRLDQLPAVPLAGTEGARDPFFSPDGESSTRTASGSPSSRPSRSQPKPGTARSSWSRTSSTSCVDSLRRSDAPRRLSPRRPAARPLRTGRAAAPRSLFRTATRLTSLKAFDVAPDGRFVVLLDQDDPPPLQLVRDWTALLDPGER